MVLMPLVSDEDRKAIVSLPGYNGSSLVITDGIEIVTKNGSKFYSRPAGRQVKFINLSSTIGKRQSNKPGDYSIVIYHGHYYSRDSVVGKNDECACKLPGEWCLYSRHADFFANKKSAINTSSDQFLAIFALEEYSCSKFALLNRWKWRLSSSPWLRLPLVVRKNVTDRQSFVKLTVFQVDETRYLER